MYYYPIACDTPKTNLCSDFCICATECDCLRSSPGNAMHFYKKNTIFVNKSCKKYVNCVVV